MRRLGCALLAVLGIALVTLPGCYRTETTRTGAMGSSGGVVGDYDETLQNRAPTFVPNKRSRVW
jgi:hypothetical protein